MLKDAKVAATIAVRDLVAARKFYEETLGLHPVEMDGDHYVSYDSGHGALLVYQSKFAGGYKATVATFTAGDDLDNIVVGLKARGVHFEHYDMSDTDLKGDIHISGDMKVAWFTDPDENIICLVNA